MTIDPITPEKQAVVRRILRCLLGTAAVASLIASLRPSDSSGLAPDQAWAQKVTWRANAEVVFAGDSRVYRSVSPAEFARHSSFTAVRNFAFSGNGYNPAYLEATRRVLDDTATTRIIALGISPHSLTERASRDNGFVHWNTVDSKERVKNELFGSLLYPFRPAWPELVDLFKVVTGRRAVTYRYVYHEDGWVASERTPVDVDAAIPDAKRSFRNNQISPPIVDGVLQACRTWVAEGIRVVAFRPPTTIPMRTLEDSLSGFDEAAFGARWTAAGCEWLQIPVEHPWTIYDGSHLSADAAIDFTRYLTRAMGLHR
jgi:hypothetical protein